MPQTTPNAPEDDTVDMKSLTVSSLRWLYIFMKLTTSDNWHTYDELKAAFCDHDTPCNRPYCIVTNGVQDRSDCFPDDEEIRQAVWQCDEEDNDGSMYLLGPCRNAGWVCTGKSGTVDCRAHPI